MKHHRVAGKQALFALAAMYIVPLRAQAPHALSPKPSFEVASVRPFRPGHENFRRPGNDEIYILGRTARFLIEDAYNLPPGASQRVIGGSAWVDSNLYEIYAKIDPTLAAAMQNMNQQQLTEERRLLMQSLLEDRFQLKLHTETRELPAYALEVAKGGAKLTKSEELPPPDPSQPTRPRDPKSLRGNLMIVPKGGPMLEMIAQGETMQRFADMLTPHPEIGGRTVVDRTGLTGSYDFELDWAREQEAGATDAAAGPGLFTALEQQLGLRLVGVKAPVDVLVIDHIEQPGEN